MRVLVAGSAGFLGRAAVRSLARAGHEVLGLVRFEDRVPLVEASGGTPVLGDVLKPDTLRRALQDVDAVVHLASSHQDFEPVRVAGCRNLAAAAGEGGARRFVVGSGYWLFGHHEGTITEATPPDEEGEGRVNLATERVAAAAAEEHDFDVVVARPGMVYGDGSWFRFMVDRIRAGDYEYLGDGGNHWSPVHIEDAGEAFRAILESGNGGEVYLVVDDEPVPVVDFCRVIASELGVPEPESMPRDAAIERFGRTLAMATMANQRASNAKLKGLGWRPRHSTSREGIRAVLPEMLPGS